MEYTSAMLADSLDYLALLSTQYPSIQSASSQIINLSAICCLPKGTEHFMSDLHGESYATHPALLRSRSTTFSATRYPTRSAACWPP